MRARYLMLVLILSLSSTGLLTAQPVPDYVPAGNLLGWWPFSGDLNDKSGAGKHGYGGVPTLANDKDGAPNNAYHFDNTYAVLPSLSFNTAGNWSVSFWMKLIAFTEEGVVMDLNENMQCTGSPQIWQRYDAVHLSNCIYGTNNTLLGSRQELLNTWHHFVIANTGGSVVVYRNGEVKSQGSYSWPVTSVIDITLANHRNSISPYFDRPSKVSFDEVGVWSSALTPCEVIALYLEGSPNYIVQQPVGQFQAAGGTVKFYIQDTGTNTAYQWQSNSGMGYQNLSNAGQYGGVFSDTLTVENITAANHNQYFRCIVTQNGICADTSEEAVLTVVPAGIEAVQDNMDFVVYPNPASDIIIVSGTKVFPEVHFMVTDIVGKKQMEGNIAGQKTSISISHLPQGMYLLQLDRGGDRQTVKFIKDK